MSRINGKKTHTQNTVILVHRSLCMYVCFLPIIHSGHTSSSLDVPAAGSHRRGRSHRIFYPPSSAVRALIFLARRIQPFLSLVDCEVESCVLTIYSFSTRWAFFILFFSFLVRKIPFAGIELTSQRVRGLRGTSELPGRPAATKKVYSLEHKQCYNFVIGKKINTLKFNKSTDRDILLHDVFKEKSKHT